MGRNEVQPTKDNPIPCMFMSWRFSRWSYNLVPGRQGLPIVPREPQRGERAADRVGRHVENEVGSSRLAECALICKEMERWR